MRSVWCWGGCALLALCLSACRPNATTGTGGSSDIGGSSAKDGQRGLRVRPQVSSFSGRWGLVILQPLQDQKQQVQYHDICVAIFEFLHDPAKNSWEGKVVATRDDKYEMKIDRLAIEGAHIEMDINGTDGEMKLQGALSDGVVRGSVIGSGGVQPISLKPTDETSFEGWDSTPLSPGLETLMESTRQKNQLDAILAAAKELKGSPLSLEAYKMVCSNLPRISGLTDDRVRRILADYQADASLWGPPMRLQAQLTGATAVTTTRNFPKLALELIEKVSTQGIENASAIDSHLNVLREQANMDIALEQLESEDSATQEDGFRSLQGLLSSQKYNPELLAALGEHAFKTGQKDLSEGYFAEILAMPLLEAYWYKSREGKPPGDPTPRERFVALWEEQHGNKEGIDAFLAEVSHRELEELLNEVKSSGPETLAADVSNHTVLVELFTGAGCPPCVAADLALDVVRKAYSDSKVVTLRFHQHIPMPDPLCNQDSEDRLAYYKGTSTPTAFVDGIPVPQENFNGDLRFVQRSYAVVRSIVDFRLKATNEVSIEATAAVESGELHVEAGVTGVPDDVIKPSRLRLAVVEDAIDMPAPNGIRHHELVVREMLGTAKGIGSKGGKLTYSLQMPLAELKEHLVDYLKRFEAGRGVNFPVRPLGLKPLSLVVWVQNDQTREVLQTVMVPITGELIYPGDAPAATVDEPASAATPANTK